jgi:hypothetical protein
LASNYHIVAGSVWGAFVGMLLVLVSTATGLILLHRWEWFLLAIGACIAAGAIIGILIEILGSRAR